MSSTMHLFSFSGTGQQKKGKSSYLQAIKDDKED